MKTVQIFIMYIFDIFLHVLSFLFEKRRRFDSYMYIQKDVTRRQSRTIIEFSRAESIYIHVVTNKFSVCGLSIQVFLSWSAQSCTWVREKPCVFLWTKTLKLVNCVTRTTTTTAPDKYARAKVAFLHTLKMQFRKKNHIYQIIDHCLESISQLLF